MSRIRKQQLLPFILVLAAGVVLHFLYDLIPILPVAVIAPVDESLFQHLKVLYLPLVAAALWLSHTRGTALRPYLLGLLVASALLLIVGWLYHITLGGEGILFDLVLYVVLVMLEFLIPHFCPEHPTGWLWDLVAFAAILLGVLLVLFTFLPPDHQLFTDLSGANTWAQLPC